MAQKGNKQPQAAEETSQAAEGEANGNGETKSGTQGSAVTLPNGVRRIDFIRDNYYDKDPPYAHVKDKNKSRSDIKNEINNMLKAAGREGEAIAYQIVFAATKTKVDPRKVPKQASAETAAADAPAPEAAAS